LTPNDLVILFDVDSDIEDLKRNMIRNPKIISFSYDAHEILENNNIEHEISDAYLTRDELIQIQNRCYDTAKWFENRDIAENISYQDINLGSFIQTELNYLMVPFVKKFLEIRKIVKEFNDADFLVSSTFYHIIISMTDSVIQLSDNKKNDNAFYYDSIKISMNIRKKNLTFKLSRKRYESIRRIFDGVLDIIFRPQGNDDNNKTVLLVEFNPVIYRKFFETIPASRLNCNIFNRRRPAIWSFKSLSIIKKSGCKIISTRRLLNEKLWTFTENQKLLFKERMNSVWDNEDYFNSIFSINGITFWRFLKPIMLELFNKRSLDAIFEIELAKKLFERHHFSAILVWSEIGSTEQILIRVAKKLGIPVILLQHGYFYDSDSSGAHNMNKFQGVFPTDADRYIVWGKIEEDHQIRCGTPREIVHVLGSPQHDRIFEFDKKQEKYVLLATSGPVKENALDLTVETIQKNQDTIRRICQVVSKMNKSLVIKTHPSPDEFDPSNLAQQIDPTIRVLKTGDIAPLINDCEVFIAIDASTVILDAQLFRKPIISVSVKDSDYGIPSILQNGCLFTDIDNFEDALRKILHDTQFRNAIIDKGTNYVNDYLTNQGCASTAVQRFLKEI